MNIKEFSKPLTSKSLNESLARRFGKKIDLQSFTTEQLQDVRNKLRTKLSQVQTTESYDTVQKESYQKQKLFLDVLNAEISERGDSISDDIDNAVRSVREGKEDQAELVMAAKDMVDRITGWMEDTAEMQTETMLELADAIRDEHGEVKSTEFVSAIKPALDALYQTMATTRESLTSGVGMLTGEAEIPQPMGAEDDMADMGAEEPMGPDEDEMDLGMDSEDDFSADAAAAGGEEPAGRARRESVARANGRQLSEKSTGDYSAKKAAAGKDIGKPGKQFGKIAQSAAKKYGSKESGEKVAGAVLKNLRSKKK